MEENPYQSPEHANSAIAHVPRRRRVVGAVAYWGAVLSGLFAAYATLRGVQLLMFGQQLVGPPRRIQQGAAIEVLLIALGSAACAGALIWGGRWLRQPKSR